jgi:uncharacterized membrane protein (UPF0127 family)
MFSLRPLALLLALGAVAACGGGEPLETVVFTNDSGEPVELRVEIADTPEERRRGLMFREHLPEDQGMLFDFGQQTQAAFWMKDTSIPLSIAFISAEGVIVDLQDMEPFSTELHQSDQPYAFAVEANQGWYEKNGVLVGSAVRLPRPALAGER